MEPDTGLDALLDLNGYIVEQDLGCWVKVEAWRVMATPQIPHGIRYSLTLHSTNRTENESWDTTTAMP